MMTNFSTILNNLFLLKKITKISYWHIHHQTYINKFIEICIKKSQMREMCWKLLKSFINHLPKARQSCARSTRAMSI